jgi:hypothetical protein
MTLALDLSSSDAKLARAREHLEVLKSEIPASIEDAGPYSIRFSEVDPQTGWCSIFLVPNQTDKPRLGGVLGDFIHNLRCALDYIVTALVDANQATLTTRHQFPVYIDEAAYRAKVGTATTVVAKGNLGGIVDGLALIEQWQPYRLKPNPRADPLFVVQRFSNADKHREPVALLSIPVGSIEFDYNGTIVEKDEFAELTNWRADQESEIGRIRFDPPIAENLRVKGSLTVAVTFMTPEFMAEPEFSIPFSALQGVCDHVTMVVNLFKTI